MLRYRSDLNKRSRQLVGKYPQNAMERSEDRWLKILFMRGR